MKLSKTIRTITIATLTFTVAVAGTAQTLEKASESRTPNSDGAQLATVRGVEPTELARFELANGNEVFFIGVPQDNELMMGEISDAGNEQFTIDPDLGPAEVFARLAPEDLPVPKMIAESADGYWVSERDTVDALPKKVAVPHERFAVPLAIKAGGGSCQSGAAGANFFQANHCNTLGGPGYGSSESYCYSGSYNWIQKTSSSRRRATYTRMASCGSGTNHLRHFYSTTSGYTTQLNIYVAPQKVVSYWSAKGGVKRFRRVRFEESNTSGWVRGWIKYHSQVAE